MNVGARVRIVACDLWPYLVGSTGYVEKPVYLRNTAPLPVWSVKLDRAYIAPGPGGIGLFSMNFSENELERIDVESACPVRSCGAPNDFGVKVCWRCGGPI